MPDTTNSQRTDIRAQSTLGFSVDLAPSWSRTHRPVLRHDGVDDVEAQRICLCRILRGDRRCRATVGALSKPRAGDRIDADYAPPAGAGPAAGGPVVFSRPVRAAVFHQLEADGRGAAPAHRPP